MTEATSKDLAPRVASQRAYIEGLGIDVDVQFAPVRRLGSGALAAVELQLRGQSSNLGDPAELRRASRLMGQKSELDSYKRNFAASGSARTIADVLPVLVNTDLNLATQYDKAGGELTRMVLTVSPDDVISHPDQTLTAVARARAHGRTICVDGLGLSEHAITLLSLVEPDIIITAPDFLTRTGSREMADLTHALVAHTQRSNAVVVAEGVDSPVLRDAAITVGATYGTGRLYPSVDDPAMLLTEQIEPIPDAPVWTTPDPAASTPYTIASGNAEPRRGTKNLLIEMSKALEAQASSTGKSMVILGTFQHARHFTPTTAARWRNLAEHTGYAGIYGVGVTPMVDSNIHHAPLDPADDLVNEWTVAILGPHFAALIAARDLHDNGPDLERSFDFVQSFDRVTVTQAIQSILQRFSA